MELLIQLGIVLFLLALGYFAGSATERNHFRRLDKRAEESQGFIVTQLKNYPGGAVGDPAPQLFVAEAVIASDYLKSFLSGIRKFFGGEMRSYHSLLERARREALQRIIDQAQAAGYDTACNVRYETADIGGATNPRKGVVTVGVIASATAYRRK